MMPVLLARAPYVSGVFFDYLQWVFLSLEREGDQWQFALDGAGQPVVQQATDKRIMRQYMEKVGFNITEEIFHPDEVLAQNFVLVINEPSQGILQGISRILNSPDIPEVGA